MEIIEKTWTYLTRRQRDRRLNHLFTIDINFPKLASPVRIRSHVDFFTLPTIRFQGLVRIPGSGSRPKADRAFQRALKIRKTTPAWMTGAVEQYGELQMACDGIVRMAAYLTLREELILKT
jgi:hypothetical protein